MKSFVRTVGVILMYGSGFLMWLFWVRALVAWLGFFGAVIGIVFTPGAVIFPFIYWWVEGAFPTLYFALWGIGLVGMVMASARSGD